jgi:hypothetical protein
MWAHLASQLRSTSRRFAGLIAMVGFIAGTSGGIAAETVMSEGQVKALFLYNFAKYVGWPAEAFASPTAPITIGVLADIEVGAALESAIQGRSINGRSIVIHPITREEDWGRCHILFISASEKKLLVEILAAVETLPVLTVGETDRFADQGGIITFVKKEGRVRLNINLASADNARLKLSSKLLSVADVRRRAR